jgi:hypothetical protein
MLDNLISLTCNLLDASCQHAEAAQREGVYAGPLWDRKLPGSRDIVPFVRDFAKYDSSVRVALNDRHLCTVKLNGEAEFDSGILTVPYLREFYGGRQEPTTVQVPAGANVHPKAPALLSGQWTQFGIAKVKLGTLLPKLDWVNANGGEAVIHWDNPPAVMVQRKGPLGLIDWNVEAAITSIRLGEFKGRVLFSRKLASILAPDLEWS